MYIEMWAPRCVHPNYRDGERSVHDLWRSQGQRVVYCVNHRTIRERSSGTDRLNVDEWIETEVVMRRECDRAETDREVTAWKEWEEHRE